MVPRRPMLRAALGAATAIAGVVIAVPAAAVPEPAQDTQVYPVPDSYDAPLLVTIDELTPGEVPESGPVVVSGTVINRDVETWTGITVYPFINAGTDCAVVTCPPPITTGAGLAEAARTAPEDVVGARIPEVSASIDSLESGEVATYSITVPRSLLPVTTPGVYWFGVHALGASESTPRDFVADGRARTFLPFVPRGRDGVHGRIDTAIVVPIRYRVRHRPNGQLIHGEDWEDAFASTGQLGAPLAFGAAAVGRPVTWLVDPAVPDAARMLRRGNPPRDLGPEGSDDAEESEESPEDAEGASDAEDLEAPADAPVATAADEWLNALEIQLRGEEVLTLPYGDLDMSATPEWAPSLYPLARDRGGDVLAAWDVPTSPVIASPGGYLDPSSIPAIDDDSTLLVTDRMFDRELFPNGPPVVGEYENHWVVATSYSAATGGPGPEPRLAPIAFRQRLLAEAATRLLAPVRHRPLVVVVPRTIDSSGAAAFWTGLDPTWLNVTTVEDAIDRRPTEVATDDLSYPVAQETNELDSTVFAEAMRLIDAGGTLQNLLTDADEVAGQVRDEALAGASYHFRSDPAIATDRLSRSRRWIERRLGRVEIEGPEGVTLASDDGSFAVTVMNRLDRTVTVRIAAESQSDDIRIDEGDPVVLGADSRTTILLDAHADGPGVHNVTLTVTDVDGTPLGASVEVPIRSGQVSEVIWVILGVGAGILFVAIGLRLFRRIRGRRAEPA